MRWCYHFMIYFNVADDDDNADYEVDAHRVPQPHVCLDGGQSSSSGGAKYLVIMLLLMMTMLLLLLLLLFLLLMTMAIQMIMDDGKPGRRTAGGRAHRPSPDYIVVATASTSS